MAKVTEDQGAPGGEGEYTPLTTFVDSNVGTTPNTTVTTTANESEEKSVFETTWDSFDFSGTIEAVTETTKSTVSSTSTDDVLSATDLGTIKKLANETINNPAAVSEMGPDFWKDVAKGDASFNDLSKMNSISKLTNAISGTDCMSSTGNKNDILNGLLDNVWELMPGLENFFDCLLEDLKSMGSDLVNNIKDNALSIVKDESMSSLKVCGDMLGAEAKNCLPDYTDSLSYFTADSSLSNEENGSFINSTMSSIGGDDWFTDSTDSSIDLDLFTSTSSDAETSLKGIENESIDTGFSLGGLFEAAEENINKMVGDKPEGYDDPLPEWGVYDQI